MDTRIEQFGRLLEIMDRLRRDCPWDREQTAQSLRNNTIEETFELADAIADDNWDAIRQELGDLLLHVVFYSKIADERALFDIGGVIDGLCNKLIYRHPHVFGESDAATAGEVSKQWEALKLREKERRGGVLGGVPHSLPALVKAFRIGQKAASAGFDWQQREDVWDKVREELAEVAAEMHDVRDDGACAGRDESATDDGALAQPGENSAAGSAGGGARERLEGEFGDLFFSLVNAARLYDIDPEMALERTNRKFIDRFAHIERRAAEAGKPLRELTLDQMEAWWQEAKRK